MAVCPAPEYKVPFDSLGIKKALSIWARSPGMLLAEIERLNSSEAVACFLKNSFTPPGAETGGTTWDEGEEAIGEETESRGPVRAAEAGEREPAWLGESVKRRFTW